MMRVVHMRPNDLPAAWLDNAVPEIRIDPADARHLIGLTGVRTAPVLVSFDSGDSWMSGTDRDAAGSAAWGSAGGLTPTAVAEIGRSAGIAGLGRDLAAAADPRDPANLYLAWVEPSVGPGVVPSVVPGAAREGGTDTRLCLRHSSDGGATWSPDLRIVPHAHGAALAVNDRGEVALVYRQLTGRPPDQRWVVYLEHSINGFITMTQWVLANMPAPGTESAEPMEGFGTEQRVFAFREVFYGAFVADRRSSLTQFPSGTSFPQPVNIDRLSAPEPARTGPAPVSRDPFFFRFSAAV